MSINACLSSVRVIALLSPDELKVMSPPSPLVKTKLLPSDSTVGALPAADAGAVNAQQASTVTTTRTREIAMVGDVSIKQECGYFN